VKFTRHWAFYTQSKPQTFREAEVLYLDITVICVWHWDKPCQTPTALQENDSSVAVAKFMVS